MLAVPVIIGLNVVVFVAWWASSGSPLLRALMALNFVVSTAHLKAGLVWTLVTSEFSHIEFWHIAINMFVLWSFGRLLERLWGTRTFTGFFLVAAVIASVSHCGVSSLLLGDGTRGAVGASGAVSGLLVAYALTFPRHRIYLFGVVPIPAMVGALGFIALDLWGLFAQTQGGGLAIGHGAHLGGALAGALMYRLYLRDRFGEKVAALTRGDLSRAEVAELERIRVKVRDRGVAGLDSSEHEFLMRLRDRFSRPN